MIDLLKNYKELKNAPGYTGSLRYFLAKKKLDVSMRIPRPYLLNGSSPINKPSNSFCRRHSLAN